MLIAFTLLVQLSWADRTADPAPGSFDKNFKVQDTTRFHKPANTVETELLCIRNKTENKLEMIKMPAAEEMIKHMAPYLQKGFDHYNETALGRALFYSQAIEESGGFTQVAEAVTLNRQGADPIAHEITDAENDITLTKFTGTKPPPASMKLAGHRGRGLLQLTGCANYLSVTHYLNQQYSGESEPVWRQHWPDWKDSAGQTVQLEPAARCSSKQLHSFEKMYNNKYSDRGWHANLYGALHEPQNFSRLGFEFTDPVSKKKISSEKLMVDGSLAYWRGQCGETVRAASDPAKLKVYRGCENHRDSDYVSWAARCVTACIKGSSNGWQKRAQWLRKALACSAS